LWLAISRLRRASFTPEAEHAALATEQPLGGQAIVLVVSLAGRCIEGRNVNGAANTVGQEHLAIQRVRITRVGT
jgi:hypothetical protein